MRNRGVRSPPTLLSRASARALRWWPRLNADQARAFGRERQEAERDRLGRNTAIGTLLYASFALGDVSTVTDIVPFALILRLAVVTPLILANYPLRRAAHRRGNPGVAELLTAMTALGVQLSIAVLLLATHSPHAQGYYSGFFPTMVYFALTLRVRLPLALVTMLGMGLVAVGGVQCAAVLAPEIAAETSTVLIATVVLLLIMLVSREVDLRRAFLLRARLREAIGAKEAGLEALQDANARLAELTELDELTQLPNRRALEARLRDWDAQGRHGVIAMVDVDHFKVFNDVHGHATGDACLRSVAATMQRVVRDDGAFVARYGGEEFTLVMPGGDANSGAAVTERLRAAVEACEVGRLVVTVSVGWTASSVEAFVPSAELLQRADEAVLAAKAAGRNRVIRAELDPVPAVEAVGISWP